MFRSAPIILLLVGLTAFTIAAPSTRPSPTTHSSRPKGIAANIQALSDSDPDARTRAIETLAHSDPKAYVAAPAILKIAASDPEPQVRVAAFRALGSLYSERFRRVPPNQESNRDKAIAACASSIDDPQTEVRGTAIESLGFIGPAASAHVPTLLKLLNDEREERLHRHAARALRMIDPNTLPTMRDLLAHTINLSTQRAILFVLGESNTPADQSAATSLLKSPDPTVVAAAIGALSMMHPVADATLNQIEQLVTSPDDEVRSSALRAASRLFPPDRFQPLLDKAASDPSPTVQATVKGLQRRSATRRSRTPATQN